MRKYKLTGVMLPDVNAEIPEIMIRSPLGKVILGRSIGETVKFVVDNKRVERCEFEVQIISKEPAIEKEKTESQPE